MQTTYKATHTTTQGNMKNIAVFASGNGSNCENIIRHFSTHTDIGVSVVVCNRKEARVIDRAKALGINTVVLTRTDFQQPRTVLSILEQHNVSFIILAGFLLMVPEYLVNAYPDRILNIHPSLLPKYGGKGMYGQHVHDAVYANREKETGITIHLVNNECDGGQVIAQYSTPLTPDDTPQSIALKVHELEMNHFPAVIEQYLGRF